MDMFSALLGPVSKDDELKALADTLRKRKRAADFYSLSTIKPLQAMGQNAGQETVQAAERQGVLREALARRQAEEEDRRLQRELQSSRDAETAEYRRQMLEMQQNQIDAANDRADQQTALRYTLAQMKAEADANKPGKGLPTLKPTARVQDNVTEFVSLSGAMRDIDSLYSGMTEDQKKTLDSGAKSTVEWAARGASPGLGNIARNKLYGDENIVEYLDIGSQLEGRLSQLASGMALTGYEIDQRTTWSPFAPGITQKQRQNRMKRLKREFGDKAGAYTVMYPGYFEDILSPVIQNNPALQKNKERYVAEDQGEISSIEDLAAGIEDGTIDIESLTDEEIQALEAYTQ